MIKKTIYLFLFIGLLFISCKKENTTTSEPTQEETITRKWKLNGLVNISDEQKYLNSVLEFKSTKIYINIENTGDTDCTGTWEIENDSLILTNGIFQSGQNIHYKLLILNSGALKIQEHYILDQKDTTLEYHYVIL